MYLFVDNGAEFSGHLVDLRAIWSTSGPTITR
jgi:hypothetical protein